MNANWSSEDDETLIDFVRVNEILYNVKNKDFRQTKMKQKLWCKVGEILNKTDTDCYKRWCYVRDYYIRRKGKLSINSSGEAAKKRSDLLYFLDSFTSSQKNSINNVIEVGNTEEITQDNSEQTPFQSEVTEDMTFKSEGDSSTDTYNNNDNSNGFSENVIDINKEFEANDYTGSNQKRKSNSQAQECLNLIKQIVQREPSSQNELDENDLFFSSMAKIVKKLPRYEQVQLRMQIGSWVGNVELRCIAND